MNIEISNICNLQCGFCPEVIRSKKIMSVELFRRVIQEVAPLTEQVCFHLMGDPLVHPRLEELVQICHEAEVRIFLVTNGTLMRPEKSELLLHPAFRQVCFSLHSFPDNFPGQDPGPYLERIFQFTEKALEKRPDLYINFRLWNLQVARGEEERNRELLTRIEQRFGMPVSGAVDVRVSKSRKIEGRLYLHFDTEFVWPALDLPPLGTHGTCYGLSSHFGVLADGTVVPCCLDKEGAIALGNIEHQSLTEVLDTPRAQAMLQGFKRGTLVEELCRRCQYIERFSPRSDANQPPRRP